MQLIAKLCTAWLVMTLLVGLFVCRESAFAQSYNNYQYILGERAAGMGKVATLRYDADPNIDPHHDIKDKSVLNIQAFIAQSMNF